MSVTVCKVCGSVFEGRRQKTTCSNRCRQKLYRLRQRADSRGARLGLEFGLSPRDFWGTNPEDFALLDSLFGFGLDAAALADDTTVPGAFITPTLDAFRVEWGPLVLPGRCAVYLNPPFSAAGRTPRGRGLLAWVQRSAEQARRWGLTVVVQLPHAPDTRAGRFCHREAPVGLLWPGRLKYLHPDTRRPQAGNSHASISFVFQGGASGPARYFDLARFAAGAPGREGAIADLRVCLVSDVGKVVKNTSDIGPLLRNDSVGVEEVRQ